MDPFPFKKKFDIIFCRNVMIYFDNETKINLVKKFYNVILSNFSFCSAIDRLEIKSSKSPFKNASRLYDV